jgi:Na+/H+-dicarboxylate symporter
MKSRLTLFVVLAMIAGPLVGLLLHRELGTGPAADSTAAGLSLVTDSFLRLIKMIIAPLVFSTLVVGIARMEGAASIARMSARTLGWFVFATLVSMAIGLAVVQIVKPGLAMSAAAGPAGPVAIAPPEPGGMLDHLIPSSIVQAMASNEILQIVVFSVLFGAAAWSLAPKVRGLIDALDQFAAVMMKLTRYIMALAPIAIFTALAATVLTQGSGVLLAYAEYIASFYIALVLLWIFLGGVLYFNIGRQAPQLLRSLRAPLLVAFSTASSAAAYPQTLERLEAFGVGNRIAAFVLPLGYSFNLGASAMFCIFGVLFIAQIYRIDLSAYQQIVLLLTLMVTSKGITGVPRAGLLVIAGSLGFVGLPEQGLAFVIAVDHLLDMGRTATNVAGNAVASALVAKWEGELRETVVAVPVGSGGVPVGSSRAPR